MAYVLGGPCGLHRDGAVSYFSGTLLRVVKEAKPVPQDDLDLMPEAERERVVRHMKRHGVVEKEAKATPVLIKHGTAYCGQHPLTPMDDLCGPRADSDVPDLHWCAECARWRSTAAGGCRYCWRGWV